MEENYKDEMIVIDNVNRYNEIFGNQTSVGQHHRSHQGHHMAYTRMVSL